LGAAKFLPPKKERGKLPLRLKFHRRFGNQRPGKRARTVFSWFLQDTGLSYKNKFTGMKGISGGYFSFRYPFFPLIIPVNLLWPFLTISSFIRKPCCWQEVC
jgi:hypothetical protein